MVHEDAKPNQAHKKLAELEQQGILRSAVSYTHLMLPKNTLGRAMAKKLKVYAGAEHPHMAQQPREIKMEDN